MSEINTIKTTGQLGVNTNKAINAKVNPNDDKLLGPQDTNTSVDTVSLTNTATQLQSLQQKLAETPEVDNDRVSAIRAAIAAGSYSVDPVDLAKNMVNFEQKLS